MVRRYAPEICRIDHNAIDTVFGGRVWRLVEFETDRSSTWKVCKAGSLVFLRSAPRDTRAPADA